MPSTHTTRTAVPPSGSLRLQRAASAPSWQASNHPRSRGWVGVLGALALSAGLLGCQWAAPVEAATPATAMARLKAEIGEARCTADSQCQTVAVGEKACGGPEAWMAYAAITATATADNTARVREAAAQTVDAARQRNQQGGLMSTCQFVPDPGARCEAGRCVLRSRGLPLAN